MSKKAKRLHRVSGCDVISIRSSANAWLGWLFKAGEVERSSSNMVVFDAISITL
jgi:hypothetical protein